MLFTVAVNQHKVSGVVTICLLEGSKQPPEAEITLIIPIEGMNEREAALVMEQIKEKIAAVAVNSACEEVVIYPRSIKPGGINAIESRWPHYHRDNPNVALRLSFLVEVQKARNRQELHSSVKVVLEQAGFRTAKALRS